MSIGLTLDQPGASVPLTRIGSDRDVEPLVRAFRESGLTTPSYVHDVEAFHENGRLLKRIEDDSGARILLAQKAFSTHRLYPILRKYLAGTAASSLYEARLGAECFGGEVHMYSPGYQSAEMPEILDLVDHLVFNSVRQWQTFRDQVKSHHRKVSPGLRINPEYSESTVPLYDPCSPGSRFGVIASQLKGADLRGIEGFHFHTLCEQGPEALGRTLDVVLDKFGSYLPNLRWMNLGGGHLITSPDYDVDHLIGTIISLRNDYPHLDIYLEPGEAVASHAGVLMGSVLDIVENGMQVAVLDVSAIAHMPDILEMPYRPHILGAGNPDEKRFTYRLGGPTCLSGDVIGDYSFDRPLEIGDQVAFLDQAHYTVVKNTYFNGIRLPSISLYQEDGEIELICEFSYEDYRRRLG